jgi:dipeptidyl aminopeptidase/acylaminoacyl peptidase
VVLILKNEGSSGIPILVVFLVLCAVAKPEVLFAQQVVPLAAEDALNMHVFGEVSPMAFSPDGRLLAFMVQDNRKIVSGKNKSHETYVRTGIYVRNRLGDVWVSNTETGETTSITGGKGSNWDPSWSPDGHYLAFLSDRDGSGQSKLWVWDSVKDTLKMVSNICVRAQYLSSDIKWTPDSRNVVVTTVPEGLSLEHYVQKALSPPETERPEAKKVPASTVVLYSANLAASGTSELQSASVMNLDSQYLHDLALVDIATGATSTIVHGQTVASHSLSPKGAYIAYANPTAASEVEGSHRLRCNLVTVNLSTNQKQIIASDILLEWFSWSPDDSLIAYGAYDPARKGWAFYVAGATGGGTRKVASLPREPLLQTPSWDEHGEHVYYAADGALWRASVSQEQSIELARIPNRSIKYRFWKSDGLLWTSDYGKSTIVVAHDDEQKQDGFYELDLVSGSTKKLLEVGQCYSCKWAVDFNSYIIAIPASGQKVAYFAEDPQHASDIWISDLSFRSPRQLTHLNPQLEKYKMGSTRVIEWLSDDGVRLHGTVVLPSAYAADKRYPLLVWNYPGAMLSDLAAKFDNDAPLNTQLFATRGYAVLFPDAPLTVGEPLVSLVKSVLPGVNKVVELGIGDPQRIGVIGHSGGGYSTLALITQTTRFKAAMELSGAGNLTGFYGVMDEDGSSTQYHASEAWLGRGGPWQIPLKYLQGSPIFYFDRIETPLLIAHGSVDEAVPSFLGDEVFVGMRLAGKKVEYAKYTGESHAPSDWSYANQLDLANRAISWFDKYMNPAIRAEQSSSSLTTGP